MAAASVPPPLEPSIARSQIDGRRMPFVVRRRSFPMLLSGGRGNDCRSSCRAGKTTLGPNSFCGDDVAAPRRTIGRAGRHTRARSGRRRRRRSATRAAAALAARLSGPVARRQRPPGLPQTAVRAPRRAVFPSAMGTALCSRSPARGGAERSPLGRPAPGYYCAAAAVRVSRKAGITSFANRSRSSS